MNFWPGQAEEGLLQPIASHVAQCDLVYALQNVNFLDLTTFAL